MALEGVALPNEVLIPERVPHESRAIIQRIIHCLYKIDPETLESLEFIVDGFPQTTSTEKVKPLTPALHLVSSR